MNADLMKAVLAMDVYNRGVQSAMSVSSITLGTYTWQSFPLPQGSDAASFYAAAYVSTDGSTVISYRGTDDKALTADPLNGFPIGAGIPFGPQFFAAFEFYNAVSQASGIDPDAISFTGHSLGGGLAGLVAAIEGKNAEIFANMPFEAAVDSAYQYMIRSDQPLDTDPDAAYSNPVLHDLADDARALIYGEAQPWQPMIGSNLHGYAVKFETLGDLQLRILQSTPDDGLDPGTLDVASLSPNERHSMALHTLLLWEKDNAIDVKWWKVVADNLWDASAKDAIGTELGFPQNTQNFESAPGQQLQTVIAYSVIDEGARPFGDTAVKALFNDANDLGNAVYQDSSNFLRDDVVQGDIANLTAHYAGLLAKNAVLQSNSPDVIEGITTLNKESGSLSIDLSDAKWTVNGALADPFGRSDFIDHVVGHSASASQLQYALSWYIGASQSTYGGYDVIGSVTFDLLGSVDAISAIDVPSGQLDLIAVIQGANAEIRGDSDDFLLGSEQADYLLGGGGVDILIGGDADDTLAGGGGADLLDGGDGFDTSDYSKNASFIAINYDGLASIKVKEGAGGTDTLRSIEKIVGTAGRDLVKIGGEIAASTQLTIDANGGQSPNPRDTIHAGGAGGAVEISIDSSSGTGYIKSIATGGQINLVGFHTGIIGSGYNDEITDLSTGHKQIDGGGGDDAITVGDDGALVIGGGGDDTLTGGAGNDQLFGGTGSDHLIGGDGSDLLVGGDVSDFDAPESLDGGAGDDKLVVRGFVAQSMSLDGGAGNDTYDIQSSAADTELITINFGPGSGHDTLLLGDYSQAKIVLNGVQSGDVKLVWDAHPNPDADPQNGIAPLIGDLALVIISTGDSILFKDFTGGYYPFDDAPPNVIVDGNVQFAIIDQVSNLPHIQLGDGDVYFVDGTIINADMVIGSVASYDLAEDGFASGIAGDGPVAPTDGADDIAGTVGNDNLAGGLGDDQFDASGGTDAIDGGDGHDILNLFGSRASFTITRDAAGVVTVVDQKGFEGTSVLTSVEAIYFAHDGKMAEVADLFPLQGTAGDDTLTGSAGDNEILALAGNDVITGLEGDDTINGGAGTDAANYAGNRDDYAVGRMADGSVLVWDVSGAEGRDTLSSIEELRFAGDASTLVTSALADPSAGNSIVVGSTSSDIISANSATSVIDGGNGFDIVSFDKTLASTTGIYFDQDGVITFDAYPFHMTFANVEGFQFSGEDSLIMAGDLTPLGTAGDDVIHTSRVSGIAFGFDGNDQLIGTVGKNELYGGAGDDILDGADGFDRLDGGDGVDVAVFDGSIENYRIYLQSDNMFSVEDLRNSDNYGLLTDVEFASFNGGATTLAILDLPALGTDGDDALIGSAYNDYLSGGSGDDSLTSGLGKDVMNGGDGNDTYIWEAGDGNDIIDDQGYDLSDHDVLDISTLSSEDVEISRTGDPGDYYGDLIITIASTSETLTILNYFNVDDTSGQIEEIRFANNVTWTQDDINNALGGDVELASFSYNRPAAESFNKQAIGEGYNGRSWIAIGDFVDSDSLTPREVGGAQFGKPSSDYNHHFGNGVLVAMLGDPVEHQFDNGPALVELSHGF